MDKLLEENNIGVLSLTVIALVAMFTLNDPGQVVVPISTGIAGLLGKSLFSAK